MGKIGVYITTHRDPKNLRMSVLQILQQTVLPNVIAIHQNNSKESYEWVLRDLYPILESKNINVHYEFSEHCERPQDYYRVPLKRLIEENCYYYIKWDDDDIYYTDYIQMSIKNLQKHEISIFRKAEFLSIEEKTFDYNKDYDFTEIHCLKGASPTLAVRKNIAEEILELWEKDYKKMHEVLLDNENEERFMWEDEIICKHLDNYLEKVYIEEEKTCLCYYNNFTNSTAYVTKLIELMWKENKVQQLIKIVGLERMEEVYKKYVKNI